MMNGNRSEFIRHISECLGRRKVPAAPSALARSNEVQHEFLNGASAEELEEVFIRNAKAAGTAVYQCPLSSLPGTILIAIPQLAAGPILLTADPFWEAQHIVAALHTIERNVQVWDPAETRERNIGCAEGAAVGMAVAELGLAETGTAMIYSHQGCGRSVTLLPTTTLFIIRRESIRPRLTQAMAYLKQQKEAGLPSAIHFISAASSTA
ncbi:MAG: hypothetical protein ACD_75C00532G0001, partial [uncultured bacterium]